MDSYHDDFDFVSNSMLKILADDLQGPPSYEGQFVKRTLPTMQENAKMEIGSIVHAVALDGRPLRSVVGILPDECLNKRGGINPTKRDEFLKSDKGKEKTYWLKPGHSSDPTKGTPHYGDVKNCIAALRSDNTFANLVEREGVMKEKVIRWHHDTGLPCRCRPDWMYWEHGMLVVWDLKITPRAALFEKQFNGLKYWIQQCHYTCGLRHEFGKDTVVEYRFLAHTPNAPYLTTVNELDILDRGVAWNWYNELIEDLTRRYENNDWTHPKAMDINRMRLWGARKYVESN